MKKFWSIVILFLISIFLSPTVYAGSLKISASSTTVTQGGSVTITVNASGLAGKFSVKSSNGNVLSGGTSGEWIENGSRSYKFTTKSTGTATITVNSLDVGDLSTNGKFTGSKSITIKVVKPREKSTNNYLSSLSIEGYELSPKFSKDKLEYQLEVPAETEKINLKASKADSYASLSGTGEKVVEEGDNRFEIRVTSETGKTRTYVVIVTVKDNNPITTEIDGETYTVVKKASSLSKPELFEEKKVEIDGVEVPGFYNEISNLTLVGLRNEKAEISLYIYDAEAKTYTKYQPLTSSSVSIIRLPEDKKLKDYSKVTVTIDGQVYEGYQVSPKSNFIYFYGLRVETGNKAWYVYDKEEKTLQLYQDEEVKRISEEYEEKIEQNKVVILCLGGISILLLLIILAMVLFRKSGSKKKKSKKKTVSSSTDKSKKDDLNKELVDEFDEEIISKKVLSEDEKKLEQTMFDESFNLDEEQKKSKKKSNKKGM